MGALRGDSGAIESFRAEGRLVLERLGRGVQLGNGRIQISLPVQTSRFAECALRRAVYRAYISEDEIRDTDRQHVETAIRRAIKRLKA